MKDRQYYIDWIRVLAFGILIFYHSGLFFVDWGWLVHNNTTSDVFETWMNLVNPWRLSLLFFISGVGVSFALKSRTGVDFFGERSKKLLLPLLFGMLVIVPPQIYFKRLQMHTFSGSYTTFYLQVYDFFACKKGGLNWQHLWFVTYLWVFSFIALPFFLWLKKKPFTLFKLENSISSFLKILLFALPLSITYWTLKQRWDITNNLVSDWYNFTLSFLFFIYGYFFATQPFSWVIIEKYRKTFLLISLSALGLIKVYTAIFGCPNDDFLPTLLLHGFFRMLFVWCTILAICGFAKYYLNFSNTFVKYANQAIYPFYIIHQTITVTIGYYIADLELSVGAKYIILVIGTFGVTYLIYHFMILPFRVMCLLFGIMKTSKSVEMKNFSTSLSRTNIKV